MNYTLLLIYRKLFRNNEQYHKNKLWLSIHIPQVNRKCLINHLGCILRSLALIICVVKLSIYTASQFGLLTYRQSICNVEQYYENKQ